MRRESHVRFWEGVEVRFLRATRLIVLNERHLRRLVADYVEHYHRWRCHRSLSMDCPEPRPVQGPEQGRVMRVAEARGLYHHYERRAA